MISESEALARLVEYHDHIAVPPVSPEEDVRRGRHRVRRTRALVAGGTALAAGGVAIVSAGPAPWSPAGPRWPWPWSPRRLS